MYKTLIGTVLAVSVIASCVHAAPEGYVGGQENKPLEAQQQPPSPKPAEAQQQPPSPKPAEAQQQPPSPKPAEAQLKDDLVKVEKNELAMNSKDKIEKDELHMKSEYANLESEIEKFSQNTNTKVSADLIFASSWCHLMIKGLLHAQWKL